MDYFFERYQELKFVIIDGDLDGKDKIGKLKVSMGQIMGEKNQVLTRNLHHKKSSDERGQISITAEAVKESNETAKIKMIWENIHNRETCLFCCYAIYPSLFTISRPNQNGDYVEVFRGNGENNLEHTRFELKQKISLQKLCNSNKNSLMKFSAHRLNPD